MSGHLVLHHLRLLLFDLRVFAFSKICGTICPNLQNINKKILTLIYRKGRYDVPTDCFILDKERQRHPNDNKMIMDTTNRVDFRDFIVLKKKRRAHSQEVNGMQKV